MRAISFKIGLLGMSLLGGPVAAGELEAKVRWWAQHSPGTNSIAHAGGRAYVASGTRLQAIALDSVDMVEGKEILGELEIDTVRFGAITSVAAHGDLVAVSVTPPDPGSKTAPGSVLIYRFPFDTEPLQKFEVGYSPDMLAFSPLGNKLLVANEGEVVCRTDKTLYDPEGSISVINVENDFAYSPSEVDFKWLNGSAKELIDSGVRIYGPGATAAQDLEPEHIAIGPFGWRAWVTLQENNAVALLDLWHNPPRVVDVRPLGLKNYGAEKNAVDIIDDKEAELRQVPNLFGMYQPDGIEVGFIGGRTYLFTANEGDARDYGGCDTNEDVNEPDYGKLRVTRFPPAQHPNGGKESFAFGGRSFAVWDSGMNLIYDSGRTIEEKLAESYPKYFFDLRSDDKGPEPEDLVLGRIGGRQYLFVGLERANGVMAFDVSEPERPLFAGFMANPPDTPFTTVTDADGKPTKADGEEPERLDFVPAPSSTELALLLVTNEKSGDTRAFELSAPE